MNTRLLDEARTILGTAEEAIECLEARLGTLQPSQPSEGRYPESGATTEFADPTSVAQARQERLASITARLSALNIGALERVREEAATVLSFYVSTAVTYNRMLETLREELHALGDDADVDLNYRSADGCPGVRIHDVIRLRARPWHSVSELAWTALTSHAPASHMSLDRPQDHGFDPLPLAASRVTTPSHVTTAGSRRVAEALPDRVRAPMSLIEGREPGANVVQPAPNAGPTGA